MKNDEEKFHIALTKYLIVELERAGHVAFYKVISVPHNIIHSEARND